MKTVYMLSFINLILIFTFCTACAKKTETNTESLSSVTIGSQVSDDETCLPEEEKEPCN
ncbi:MAG: hypothetical protein ABII18_11050 [bacterium]|nr:hypothetical protein [bacterium]MBU1916649.1 hypothetical protein [bacterium]